MKYLRLILTGLMLVALVGCSTIQVSPKSQDAERILGNRSYWLRVQTRNDTMDRLVYELARNKFGKYLSLPDKGPYNGTVDVLFFKTAQANTIDPESMFSSVAEYKDRWYASDGYTGKDISNYMIGESAPSAAILTWQNSTMLVNINDHNGKRVWSVEYKYRVDGDMAGWFTDDSQEIVRVCVARIGQRMRKDLRLPRRPVITIRNFTWGDSE